MRKGRAITLLLTWFLAACGQSMGGGAPNDKNLSRYNGIGIVNAGKMWAQRAVVTSATDPAAATLADDEHIIVVVDTHTGEVRQCGDQSGLCVTMNPWAAQAAATLPAKLNRKAADPDRKTDAAPATAEPVAAEAEKQE